MRVVASVGNARGVDLGSLHKPAQSTNRRTSGIKLSNRAPCQQSQLTQKRALKKKRIKPLLLPLSFSSPRISPHYYLFSPAYQPQTAIMLGLSDMQPRQLAAQVLNFALVLSTAFMLWKGLSVVSDSPSPIVVVLSGSMEPAFQRGDLLFLWNRGLDTQVGEIVVYNVKGKDIPIVHRVVRRYGGG